MAKLIDNDPLIEADLILRDTFYGRGPKKGTEPFPRSPSSATNKPTHYKIVCFSLYNEDIAQLEGLVAELKRRGHTKANKSAVIRFALDTVDISKMPKGY